MGAHRTQWLSMLKDYPPEEAGRLIEAAIQADPTPGHVYVTWILRHLQDESFRLPEYVAKEPRKNNLVKLTLLILTVLGPSAACMRQLLSKGFGESSKP